MCDKVKRKDYEIRVLRNELSEREKQYKEACKKLSRMQTAMVSFAYWKHFDQPTIF